MKNWEEDDGTEYCTAKDDLADAQSVADELGIRLHSANFAAESAGLGSKYPAAECGQLLQAGSCHL